MKYLEPWKTQIARWSWHETMPASEDLSLEGLTNEIFTLASLTQENSDQSLMTPDFIPQITRFRESVIIPMMKEYCRNAWHYRAEDFDFECNAKWIPEGEGLYPHFHPGSCVSAIFYPKDCKNGITFFDPRTNACRGYPRTIRNPHMAPFHISPKEGELYIFPSYVQHCVSHVQEDTRLSLLHEFYFRKNV